ncbi:hypothetical protein C8J57DRAFT_1240061 [Mycena rebaudengoi]|nr:hypothetical protein C8J57DRAFT_1240061 [Mycena rebaudengoi]
MQRRQGGEKRRAEDGVALNSSKRHAALENGGLSSQTSSVPGSPTRRAPVCASPSAYKRAPLASFDVVASAGMANFDASAPDNLARPPRSHTERNEEHTSEEREKGGGRENGRNEEKHTQCSRTNHLPRLTPQTLSRVRSHDSFGECHQPQRALALIRASAAVGATVRAAGAQAGGGIGVRVAPLEADGACVGRRVQIGVGQGRLGVGHVGVHIGVHDGGAGEVVHGEEYCGEIHRVGMTACGN